MSVTRRAKRPQQFKLDFARENMGLADSPVVVVIELLRYAIGCRARTIRLAAILLCAAAPLALAVWLLVRFPIAQ